MQGWMNGVLGHFYALSRLNWAAACKDDYKEGFTVENPDRWGTGIEGSCYTFQSEQPQ